MDLKNSKKLRALVYAGLAGGLVGVATVSSAAHGNASTKLTTRGKISWDVDDIVVSPKAVQQQKATTK